MHLNIKALESGALHQLNKYKDHYLEKQREKRGQISQGGGKSVAIPNGAASGAAQAAMMSTPLGAGLALGGEALKGAKGGNGGDIKSQVRASFGHFNAGSINNGFSLNKAMPLLVIGVIAVAYFKFKK